MPFAQRGRNPLPGVSPISAFSAAIYLHAVPYPAISYTFRDDAFHPPYIGAAGGLFACGLSECVASVEHALRLFKMLLETSRKFFVIGCLCHLGGRMSGSACNRRPWLERSWAGHLSGPLGTTI